MDAARPEASPLHDYFEWDDEAAGEKYRQLQAARIMRWRIEYQALPNNGKSVIPLFSSPWPSRGENQASYTRTVVMLSVEQNADRLALDAIKRAQGQLKAIPHQSLHDALVNLDQIRGELETKLYGLPTSGLAAE